jgi:hypothetical protein
MYQREESRVGEQLRRWFGWPFLVVAIFFVINASAALDVPGVYMDAVNPDYMVVRLLNPAAKDLAVWILPGQLIFGKLPILAQLYQGALTYYVGLPFYLLFGTDLLGIRIAEIGFGLFVLLGVWLFLRAFDVRPWVAALGTSALAIDPAFVISFRTQAYIALLPLGLLLASVAVGRLDPTAARRKGLTLLASGALAGLAFFGYFFYLFPALTIPLCLACCRRSDTPYRRLLTLWSVGFVCGLSPYLLAYLRMLLELGSFSGLFAYLHEILGRLGVANSGVTLPGRPRLFLDMADHVFFNEGNSLLLLHRLEPSVGVRPRVALLLAVPAVVLAASALVRRAPPALVQCAAFVAGFVVLALVFGSRLGTHHFVAMVPILYIAFVVALDRIASHISSVAVRRGLVVLAIAPLAFANGINHYTFMAALRATGGVGLASDAIVRFAQQSQSSAPQTHFFFPDWGVFMPFAMITSGRFPHVTDFEPAAARRELCAGHDVVLALVHADGDSRLEGWARSVDWGAPGTEAFRQRDGTIVLDVARWKAGERPASAPACG